MRSDLQQRVSRLFSGERTRPREGDHADPPRPEHATLARAWGIEACEVCGRTILLGETLSSFDRDGRPVRACTLCEGRLLSEGCRRAA